MKRNSSLAKFILAAIFFQAHFAAAQNYAQQTNAEANGDAALQPITCQKVVSPYWNSNQGGSPPMVDDPACVKENNRRAQLRANARGAQGMAARVSAGDGTDLVAPKAPAYNCGSMDPHSSEYQACQSAYDAANRQYQKDLEVYNLAQKEIKEGQRDKENAALEEQKNKSAAATLAEIKAKNDQGKKEYDKTAKTAMLLGLGFVAAGTACASSCPTGCCAAAPGLFAAAAAQFLINSKAKKQSSEHAASAANACNSLNQLSSQPTDCSTQGNGGNSSSTTVGSYDPVTGKCLPEDSPECKQLPTTSVLPPTVRDSLKASGFAMGKVNGDQFSILPDGSVKLKNGKVYKDGDFKDMNSLMGMGLSAAAAKGVMDSLALGGASGLGKAGLDKEKKEYKDNYGALGGADGTTTVVDTGKGPDSGKTFSDDLEKNKGDKYSDERKPSSEGLAKEFNGELIGVAGDDIFLMMNRRYKLKSEQDSFIAQDRK